MFADVLLPSRRGRAGRMVRRLRWLLVYLVLLAASHVFVAMRTGDESRGVEKDLAVSAGEQLATIPAMTDSGAIDGQSMRVGYIDAPAGAVDGEPRDDATGGGREPIILIHGSPGSAADFQKLTPLLTRVGRRVIAIDLPGFGESDRAVPSYSVLAHARAVLALMDVLEVKRAHVVGWSMGGGVVLHLADLAPQRIASLTLMAAIGSQETEGSRSYFFEHFKYGAGRAIFMGLPEVVPHFGVMPEARTSMSHAWLRNFGDTDMRPLADIMRRLETPSLVLHGRRDFLVPDWAAERHHEIMRTSSLVMLDASHFLPFMQQEETAEHLLRFVARHDEPGVEPLHETVIIEPARAHVLGAIGRWTAALLRVVPWWGVAGAIAILALRRPTLATVMAAMLASQIRIDFAVAASGLLVGRACVPLACVAFARRESLLAVIFRSRVAMSSVDWTRRFERREPGFWLGIASSLRPDIRFAAPRAVGLLKPGVLSTGLFVAGSLAGAAVLVVVQFFPAMVLSGVLGSAFRLDRAVETAGGAVLRALLLGVTFVVTYLVATVLPLLLTWTGRRILLARIRRTVNLEFWPTWVFYVPLTPVYLSLAWRARHLLMYSTCNPGISGGGGLIGESKHEIQSRLDASSGFVLASARIPAGGTPAERAAAAIRAMESDPALSSFPIILKPDAGQRGFSVRIMRSPRDFEQYFSEMHDAAMLQTYHPGPNEAGILWSRTPPERAKLTAETARPDGATEPIGFIYSITRKDFPFITGDGRRTLEQLIYRHKRFRCQAPVFLARFIEEASRIPPAGERIRLAQSGNHCQGTLFRDGSDLITPELTRAIDRLAATFASDPAHPEGMLDIGRFDMRFTSDDELRAGRGFGILELNGTTGESTNLYDPNKSIFWSYRVLYGQWRLLFALGTWRAKHGVRPMSVMTLLKSLRGFYRARTGSELAD